MTFLLVKNLKTFKYLTSILIDMSAKKVIGSILLVVGVVTIEAFLFLIIGIMGALGGDFAYFLSLLGTPVG